MKRKSFLNQLGSVAIASAIPSFVKAASDSEIERSNGLNNSNQRFNMCGYAAPPLPVVRIGVIGLGMRGPGAVERMSFIEGVSITALCDQYEDRVTASQKILQKAGLPVARSYSGKEGWKALCESKDVDLVYICTPWRLHTPMALHAMKNEKHVAVEVPAAVTLDECWALVETSERTKKHCMMLENCCYDFFELLTLNMTRQGFFGELIHTEGAYIHDLRDLNFSRKGYAEMWRLKENATRNGNLYPTHGLGPIAQCMNINRGDKFDHLVSMSSNDFMMKAIAREKAVADPFFNEFTDKNFRGNMNTTMIRTNHGKTIMLQHDVTSPRPYSRIHLLSGTKGAASKWPSPQRIALGHGWLKEDEFKKLETNYTLPIVKLIGEMAKTIGGHGGMDFIMDWRLIDCLRNGLPVDQDVYDAASWSCIAPLSERSVAKKSRTVDIPDFTRGAWIINKPLNVSIEHGTTTPVRKG